MSFVLQWVLCDQAKAVSLSIAKACIYVVAPYLAPTDRYFLQKVHPLINDCAAPPINSMRNPSFHWS